VTPPRVVAAAVALQAAGVAWDATWHLLLHPGVEEGLDLRHVLVEHAVFNLGVLGLLVAATWALLRERRERVASAPRTWVLVAAAGAAAQAVGWGWDVAAHARASNGGPVSWTLIYLGLAVAATALLASRRSPGPGPAG
jgi:hypothetical protein